MPAPVGDRRPFLLRTLGIAVTILCQGVWASELEAAVGAAWSRCAPVTGDEPVEQIDVIADDNPLRIAECVQRGGIGGPDVGAAMDALSTEVTLRAIRRQAGNLVMLHAAALAHPRTGETLLLVGPSGAGKTTAAAKLGRHLGYLSDETAGIDADLRLVPHPKPLSLLEAGQRVKLQHSPKSLGLLRPPAECRLAGILLLDRGPYRTTPLVEEVPLLEALVALAGESSYLSRLPSPLHRLADVVRAGGCHRVSFSESASLVPIAAQMLEPT